MESLLAQSNTAFNKIADAVGYEDRLSAKREKVFTELMKLDLEMIDRFALNTMIVSAEENVDTFYGIPENYKQAWVEAVYGLTVYGQCRFMASFGNQDIVSGLLSGLICGLLSVNVGCVGAVPFLLLSVPFLLLSVPFLLFIGQSWLLSEQSCSAVYSVVWLLLVATW
ncbi:hypothetical protein C3L33_22820, partial [Rhododendron williamsianum]